MGVSRFEDLRVWQEARGLCDQLRPILERSSFSHSSRLREQIADAAASVMANIAEGFLRRHRKEFAQFARVAAGSNGELRSHLYVAESRGYITAAESRRFVDRTNTVGRMLTRLIQKLQEPASS